MSCMSCGSENQKEFASEITVHILGLENVDKPTVMVFPRLRTCMNCGFWPPGGLPRGIPQAKRNHCRLFSRRNTLEYS